jgi:hypothetical protein
MMGALESSESVERKSFTVLILRLVRPGAFVVGVNVTEPGGCGTHLLRFSTIGRVDSLFQLAWRRDREPCGGAASRCCRAERWKSGRAGWQAKALAQPFAQSGTGAPPVSSRQLGPGLPVSDRLRVCSCIPPGTLRR